MQEVVTHTLLVADPDSVTAPQLQQLLDPEGIRVAHRRDSQTLLQSLQTEEIDAVFLAHGLAQQDPSLVGILTQRFPNIPLVVMLPATSREEFARWVSAGAADFVRLPLDAEEALFTVKKLHFLSSEAEQEQSSLASGVVAQSKAMRDVFALIARVAPGTSTVMIRGESGTGKEVVARRIHEQSRRKNGPFVKVHCAALPEQILESEVFGYERGAFTGAASRKPGRVELAEGGTLFLDEIGDVSPVVQVKLLRLLQDREFERLGGTETMKSTARIVAATHQPLEELIKERKFREDLFYRLNVLPIWIPALRDRAGDVESLARDFCRQF